MFVYMPAAKATKAYKFARPFHGPYRITAVHNTGVEVRLVDRPQENAIRVALDRVRQCPDQLPNTFWPQKPRAREVESKDPPVAKGNIKQSNAADSSDCPEESHITTPSECNVWKGRLRTRRNLGEDTHQKDGDM